MAEYNCDDLMSSNYSNEDRMAIWQYKYLSYPIEKFSKIQREKIQDYINEEEHGLHQNKLYTETFYQPHEHNNVQYDINKKADEYIKVDEKNTDFTIINDEQYHINTNSILGKKKRPMLKEKNENSDSDDEIVIRNQILKY